MVREEQIVRPNALVIGIGNEFRGDDAFGLVVARAIDVLDIPNVTVIEHHGEGGSLMEAWHGYESVFLIDAVRSGVNPGTLFRLDVTQGRVPSQLQMFSSHEFGVVEAIETARALGRLPSSMILYGAEGDQFEMGVGLSGELELQIDAVVRQIAAELRAGSAL